MTFRLPYFAILCFSAIGLTNAVQGEIISSAEPEQLYKNLPNDVIPELSLMGEHSVGVRTIEIENSQYIDPMTGQSNPRSLTLEVWYPSSDASTLSQAKTFYEDETRSGIGFKIAANAVRDIAINEKVSPNYPIVILSHGYTGYRSIMFYLGEHLASHGYLVAAIDHTDSTNKDIDFTQNAGAGFLSTLLNRARDQQFVLNWLRQQSSFKSVLSKDKAGVVGYSMGGYGAINTIGGCYDFSAQNVTAISGITDEATIKGMSQALNTCSAAQKNTDSAWKAAVLMAPWGGSLPVFSASSLNSIAVPSMYISGDLDDISGYSGIRWMYEQHSDAETYLLTYHNARHNIGPHPAPTAALGNELDIGHYRDPAWDSQTLNIINEHFTLAMMDCYVKGIPERCDYLAPRGSANQTMVDGQKVEPWIGFDDRYATGMTLEARNVDD